MASGAGNHDIARRYATSFFELAQEQSKIDVIDKDMAVLAGLAASGGDFLTFSANATLRRQDQADAVVAISRHLNLSDLTEKFIGTLAQKRRLPMLADTVTAVQAMIAAHKGETTAQVTSAIALTDAQVGDIAARLKKSLGLNVQVRVNVDEAIIGGLVIRVGSRLIDSSVRTKLDRLHRILKNSNEQTAQKKMKEVA